MPPLRLNSPTRLFAGALTGLLLACLSIPMSAQIAPSSHLEHNLPARYDAAHEITINGTIQEVITKHVPGSPAGVLVLVAGSDGLVDAHLGPFVSSETKGALDAGAPVRILGAMTEIGGKQYLLARELTIGGRTITIRNNHGFLAMSHGERVVSTRVKEATKVKGGTQ